MESEEETTLLESLLDGEDVLEELDMCKGKTLLNVIYNVLLNPEYNENISEVEKRKLSPYKKTFHKLLDKKVKLQDKLNILKNNGKHYIQTFLDIIGEDLEYCKVKEERLDCPICGKERLLKLSNHLRKQHNITGEKRKQLLKQAREEDEL